MNVFPISAIPSFSYEREGLSQCSVLRDMFAKPLKPAGIGLHVRCHVREVVNGPVYIPSAGRQWRAVPRDVPPRSTVARYGTALSDPLTPSMSNAAKKQSAMLLRQRPSSAASGVKGRKEGRL
jgi:transposase